jgi:hypothetical protein
MFGWATWTGNQFITTLPATQDNLTQNNSGRSPFTERDCSVRSIQELTHLVPHGHCYLCAFSRPRSLKWLDDSEYWILKNLERLFRLLIQGTVSVFAWRDWGIPWKPSVRVVGALVDILAGRHPKTCHKSYRLSQLARCHYYRSQWI